MRKWQRRDWLAIECCGQPGAIEVETDCDNDEVCDGDRVRCVNCGDMGTVHEYCGEMRIRWDNEE
jgi:hypothetical protein